MKIQWFPGHMAKTKQALQKINKVIDIAVILVDARCPKSSFSPLIEELYRNKATMIVFTKVDLADPVMTKKWIKYYEAQGYYVIKQDLLNDNVSKNLAHHANFVLQDKFLSEQKKGMKKRRMKMLIVGIPNVGKSTLINRYSKKRVVQVGNKAGVTRQLQWIRVNDNFEILDSPGLLWPKFEDEHIGFALAVTKAIKTEVLPIDDVAIFVLNYLQDHYKEQLVSLYGQLDLSDIASCYEQIGRKFGLLKKQNAVDYERVSLRIVNDAMNNKFGKITWDYYE